MILYALCVFTEVYRLLYYRKTEPERQKTNSTTGEWFTHITTELFHHHSVFKNIFTVLYSIKYHIYLHYGQCHKPDFHELAFIVNRTETGTRASTRKQKQDTDEDGELIDSMDQDVYHRSRDERLMSIWLSAAETAWFLPNMTAFTMA